MLLKLPQHLEKYIVKQDYSKYTPQDQAVWRYCLRQLKNFLGEHGHTCYAEGLTKTGISVEYIPKISEMSVCLEKFGWTALPVSGFIPPAAFMELQSLGVLPIASDMRTIDHLLYTPAPDIVHEAAGHAPIIVDEEYADYLKQYSQVAKKAIISREDIELYEAIRDLSDTKENPTSTIHDIVKAENKLSETIKSITHTSEASQLSRMNWWTAEYGLIGDLNNPKIFGAGLLSSIGESKWCLSEKVKKLPLTVDCIEQSYDITEPQPQLFVTPDFKTLVKVLHQFADTMAYKKGGKDGLYKVLAAQSVNTIELDSGFQISGVLDSYLTATFESDEIIFIKCSGPTQIAMNDQQLVDHGPDYHQNGYSTPLGKFTASSLKLGTDVTFDYASGFKITGKLVKATTIKTNSVIYTFENATMTYDNQIFFKPEWGSLDIVAGTTVTSVYGGPADSENYGHTGGFVAATVPSLVYNDHQIKVFSLYQKIRDLRTQGDTTEKLIQDTYQECKSLAPLEWLLFVELLELSLNYNLTSDLEIKTHLNSILKESDTLNQVITDGIKLAHA
ncbi:MAG: aromatic amino acid hydroxylase [Bdellovibrionaceae bacterium]|nr:aromatic amino acid hydroxylase [Pseudobdellovibrionaceae bacterium]